MLGRGHIERVAERVWEIRKTFRNDMRVPARLYADEDPMTGEVAPASFHLKEGKRYRIRMHNASDDIHPIHLHRHSFELTKISGRATAGILKDVVMLGGYQDAEIDFVADNPGLTLFHCHQQLHMDFGFMTLFDYV